MKEHVSEPKAFSCKALLGGAVGVLLVAGLGKIAPTFFRQELLPHQLGVGIYFYFLILCAVWNPLCCRFRRSLAFSLREMSVVMILTLASGGFAFAGWLRQFYTQGILLTREAAVNPRWQLYSVTDYLKPELLPNRGVYDEKIIGGFINGLRAEKGWLPFSEIPFAGWGHFLYWGLFLLLVAFLLLALLMIVHRQWTVHENLSYPLVAITEAMLKKSDEKNCFADIFRSKYFLIAFGFVFAIHLYNFLVLFYSTLGFEPIKLRFWLADLQYAFPVISRSGCWAIRGVHFIFLLIGVAYLLAPALSLSIGLNAFLYIFFAAEVYALTGQAPGSGECQLLRLGAYIAFVILLLSLGRRYYGKVLWLAISGRKAPEEERMAVLGCRLFLILALGLVWFFTWSGMGLGGAILFTLMIVMTYLIFTRIICECGLPMMNPPFLPSGVLASLLGGFSLGPKNLMGGGMFSGVLFSDLRQTLMPFMATGMKLGSDAKLKSSGTVRWIAIAVVASLLVAVPFHLRQYYSFGITDALSKSTDWKCGVQEAFNEVSKLHISGQIRASGSAAFQETLRSVMPEKPGNYTFVLIGMGLVFACGFLRSRFVWWPLHAAVFCIWNTPLAYVIWPSFLLGWFCRTMAVRLGGEHGYLALKPFFFGLIYGDIAASGIILLTGMIHYLITGQVIAIAYQV